MTGKRTVAVVAWVLVVVAVVAWVLVAVVFGAAPPASGFAGADALADTGAGADADALAGAGATPDERQSSPTSIDSCATITEPGKYVLSGDVRDGSPTDPRTGLGACIEIRADDVLLDGAGHTIAAGPNGTPGVVGVLVSARGRGDASNVTVRNLTTTRWGAGVAIVGTENAALLNVSAVRNLGDGFFVENAPGVTIRGGEVRASNTGVFVRNAPDATIAGLTIAENLAGVSVRRADGARISGVTASQHSQFGVGVFSSDSVTVADSVVRGNELADVALARSDATLRNLTLSAANATRSDSLGWALYAVRNSTAIGEEVRVGETTVSFEATDVALDPAGGAPPLPVTERQVVGSPLVAVPTSADARLSLSIRYADAAVERASTTEETLSLWRFDAGEGWNPVETVVDADRNAASATVENLNENGTVVALVGEGLAESENETT